MAPRRGGGGEGGGGGSSSIADTPWGQEVLLSGGNFGDPYRTAQVVFHAIGLVGTIGILIWASTFRKHNEPNSKIFKRSAFWLSGWALFVSFAIRFSVGIIYEVAYYVQQIFFLVVTILYQSTYLAEISLLGVLYLLLPYCSRYISQQGGRPRMSKHLQIGHAVFIFILFAIWVSSMGLKINYQVQYVIGDPWIYRSIVRPYKKLDTAYAILYFFGALEILVWSVLGFLDAKIRSESGKIQLFLLTLIALPLLLRSTYSMGHTIHEELQQKFGNRRLYLAADIIYNLTTLVIYAGIVAIGRHIATSNLPINGPNQINPTYDPNFWGAQNGHGLPPHDPTKPYMAVHEGAPPLYQQGNFAPAPYNHQGHGNVQYVPPPPHQQPQQQHLPYQQHPQQPYPNQQQYQQHYQNQGYQQYAPPQQHLRSPQSPPPQQMSLPPQQMPPQQMRSPQSPPPQQMSPVSQHRQAPSPVGAGTAPSANAMELPSPTTTPHPHAR
ncbi:MAG: hypothetical protein Q9166_002196 [cf. Caloplaca sp. 2 TL-2023]